MTTNCYVSNTIVNNTNNDEYEEQTPHIATKTAAVKRRRGRPKGKKTTKHPKVQRPKRPMSAYNLFFKDERAKMNNNDVSFKKNLATTIADKWKMINNDQKICYQQQAAKLLLIHKEQMKVYNAQVKAIEENTTRDEQGSSPQEYKPEMIEAMLANEIDHSDSSHYIDKKDDDDEDIAIFTEQQRNDQRQHHKIQYTTASTPADIEIGIAGQNFLKQQQLQEPQEHQNYKQQEQSSWPFPYKEKCDDIERRRTFGPSYQGNITTNLTNDKIPVSVPVGEQQPHLQQQHYWNVTMNDDTSNNNHYNMIHHNNNAMPSLNGIIHRFAHRAINDYISHENYMSMTSALLQNTSQAQQQQQQQQQQQHSTKRDENIFIDFFE